MSSIAPGNHYYHLNINGNMNRVSILLKPTKEGDAEAFLKNLHLCIRENNTINLPEGTILNNVVDQVVSGYRSKLDKLDILQRNWQRFLSIITYPLVLLGINLTQAQRIQHFVKTIKSYDVNQLILISTDPAFDLKKRLINVLPINSPERTKILRYSIEQCLQKMTNDHSTRFIACECYFKNDDIEKARDLLLNFNKEDELDFITLFSKAIFICVEREIPAIDLIEKIFTLNKNISDKSLDTIASRFNKAEKIDKLIATIGASSIDKYDKDRFYDSVVKECLKKIDSNEFGSRSSKQQKQIESENFIKIFGCLLDKISSRHALEVAKHFIAIEDYSTAIQAANLSWFTKEGRALLIEISSHLTKKGQFELALKSLEKISYNDNDL
jgi:hypothetical protein